MFEKNISLEIFHIIIHDRTISCNSFHISRKTADCLNTEFYAILLLEHIRKIGAAADGLCDEELPRRAIEKEQVHFLAK